MTHNDSQKDNGMNEEDFIFEDEEEVIAEGESKDKIKDLRKNLKEALEEKRKAMEDLQRAKADFVNMRRRDDADKVRAVLHANEDLLNDIIPALDSFDMAFKDPSWIDVPLGFKKGVEQIYNQIIGIITKYGVEELNPEGEEFNPSEHTAIGMTETDREDEDHKISEVVQKGYKLNEKVIRSPKVKVKQFKK